MLNKLKNSLEKKGFWGTAIQFIKFCIVGLANTFISLGIYYIFIAINPDYYLIGGFVGWFVSVLNAFYLSNRFVFKTDTNSFTIMMKRLLKSYATYGATFLLSQILLYLQVSVLEISEWIAPVLNLIATIPINFVFNKIWTFKK